MQFATWISRARVAADPAERRGLRPRAGDHLRERRVLPGRQHTSCPSSWPGCRCCSPLGFWAGGARLAVFWAPVLGALAVFTFGGLVARLVGPRWAPLGALAIGDQHPRGVREPQHLQRAARADPVPRRRCRCGSTCSAPTGARRTPDGGGPTGGRTRGPPRTCSRGSPGCCSASRCSCASTGRPTSCSSSRTAAC